jgi:hypothetical protein
MFDTLTDLLLILLIPLPFFYLRIRRLLQKSPAEFGRVLLAETTHFWSGSRLSLYEDILVCNDATSAGLRVIPYGDVTRLGVSPPQFIKRHTSVSIEYVDENKRPRVAQLQVKNDDPALDVLREKLAMQRKNHS